jgi:hypothetical protein
VFRRVDHVRLRASRWNRHGEKLSYAFSASGSSRGGGTPELCVSRSPLPRSSPGASGGRTRIELSQDASLSSSACCHRCECRSPSTSLLLSVLTHLQYLSVAGALGCVTSIILYGVLQVFTSPTGRQPSLYSSSLLELLPHSASSYSWIRMRCRARTLSFPTRYRTVGARPSFVPSFLHDVPAPVKVPKGPAPDQVFSGESIRGAYDQLRKLERCTNVHAA